MILRALLLVVLLGGLAPQSAQADPDDRWERRQERREQRREDRLTNGLAPQAPESRVGPGEAARQAQAQNGGGRVLGVQQIGGGWQVKLLKDGEVRSVFVQDR